MRALLAAWVWTGLLLAQHPALEEAWGLLAKGDRPQAIRLLQELIHRNPQDADARLLLGSVLAEQKDHAGALAQLEAAVRLRPRSAEAQNALGEAYKTFGDGKAARAPFERAAALDPNFAAAQENLGLVLLEAGELDLAAAHLDHTLHLMGHTPDSAYARYLRAKVYTERNAVAQAVAELEEAVRLRPDFAESWSDLGQARKTLLDDTAALAAFERAVSLSPEDAVAQYRLGAEYFALGRNPPAIEHLEAAVHLSPENQSALYSLQLALRAGGQAERAGEIKRRLADLLLARDRANQKSLEAVQINNQGAALEKAGNLRGALEKYRAALELNPQHVGIRVNLAAALLRLGRWTEGIAELQEAQRREPGNESIRKALAAALAQSPEARHNPPL
jgi:tetratricopeptide (TPR) repeat protein